MQYTNQVGIHMNVLTYLKRLRQSKRLAGARLLIYEIHMVK